MQREVWYVGGSAMKITKWSPSFRPQRDSIVSVWVSFPELPPHLFERTALFRIATAVGTPLKSTESTANFTKPAVMARVCVEVDLSLELEKRLWIEDGENEGFWQEIRYENVPLFCRHCKIFNHTRESCWKLNPEFRNFGIIQARKMEENSGEDYPGTNYKEDFPTLAEAQSIIANLSPNDPYFSIGPGSQLEGPVKAVELGSRPTPKVFSPGFFFAKAQIAGKIIMVGNYEENFPNLAEAQSIISNLSPDDPYFRTGPGSQLDGPVVAAELSSGPSSKVFDPTYSFAKAQIAGENNPGPNYKEDFPTLLEAQSIIANLSPEDSYFSIGPGSQLDGPVVKPIELDSWPTQNVFSPGFFFAKAQITGKIIMVGGYEENFPTLVEAQSIIANLSPDDPYFWSGPGSHLDGQDASFGKGT